MSAEPMAIEESCQLTDDRAWRRHLIHDTHGVSRQWYIWLKQLPMIWA